MFREKLAEGFGGDLACPLATKWFIRISVTLDFLEENVMPFVEVIPLERKDFKLMKISRRL